MKTSATIITVACSLLVGACVTEEPARRRPQPAPAPKAAGEKAVLPEGKVAEPVPLSATTSATLSAIIYPAGSVPYDGLSLPLVSPDGKFLAVEQGTPPTWDTLTASPGQAPSLGTRLAVYDISRGTAKETSPPEQPPRGAILGRSCDAAGYLVESPQPDGSRWLARVSWLSGRSEWLAQGQTVNAHGTLSPAGLFAFVRSPVAGKAAALVLRGTDGREAIKSLDDSSAAYPLFSPDGRNIFAFFLSDRGMEFVGFRLDNPREPAFGNTVMRQLVTKTNELALAYQCVAPVAPCLPGYSDESPDSPVLILHPVMARMAALDMRDGAFVGLSPRSQAAIASPFPGNPGYIQTTPEGLTFIPPPSSSDSRESRGRPPIGAKLMDAPYVPRSTTNPDRPLVLFGPAGKNDLNRLVVLGMGLAPPPKD